MFVRVLLSLKYFLRYLSLTSHLSVFHILMSIVLDHERCIEWYIFMHLYVISNVINFSDMLQYVLKGVFSVMLTPHKLLEVAFDEFLGCSCTGITSLHSPPCIFDALCVGTCVWVYKVHAVLNREMFVALVC